MVFAFHCNARLMLRSTTSSSAKLMCLSSCTGHCQFTSSATAPLLSTTTLVANELISTQTVASCLLMHPVPGTGSACVTFAKMSAIIQLTRSSFISLSHPGVKAFTLDFTNVVATHNQPYTGKYPVNFPHTEKIT